MKRKNRFSDMKADTELGKELTFDPFSGEPHTHLHSNRFKSEKIKEKEEKQEQTEDNS